MSGKTPAPYGSWASPITPGVVASASNVFSEIQVDSKNQALYWLERRPKEEGRTVILRKKLGTDSVPFTLTPPGFNVRTRVHEYGGASYIVLEDTIFFSNFRDQGVYSQRIEENTSSRPSLVTPGTNKLFFADYIFDERKRRLICVREDHRKGDIDDTINTIVTLPLSGGEGDLLASGKDFYSSPRLSPDGSRLAWLSWDHPLMPFYGSELWLGDITNEGKIENEKMIAGGPNESVSEPVWSPKGVLHFVSDRTGWWNIYRLRDHTVENVCKIEAEFTSPHWVFGLSSYSFLSDDLIVCAYSIGSFWNLGLIETTSGKLRKLDLPYTDLSYVKGIDTDSAVFVAASSRQPLSIVMYNVGKDEFRVLYSFKGDVDLSSIEKYLSKPEAIEYPTTGGLMAHGIYYPPTNADFEGQKGETPPLVVVSHGGPTSSTSTRVNLGIQYWTSRGFAVLDVNYGGSTGYGREYRMRLNGKWGIVDVDDCVNGALFLAKQSKADRNRLVIRGGSAGGYTTLCALAFRDVFGAGASYYGLSDLEIFVKETHKFESRYLESLVGPFPERKDLYRERSAINYLDRISAPIIFFQGLEDKIVPPNQAEKMFEALVKRGIPTAYVPFEGEQHGFRQAKNIARAFEAELYFYSKVFGFETADRLEPVDIKNLKRSQD